MSKHTKPSVLLLHGWQGSNAPHWQDWLAKSLIAEGIEVSFPQLSDNMSPKKEQWIKEAKEAFDTIEPNMVITHSLGAVLWFHLCNEGLVHEVKRLLIVAPPRDLSDYEAVRDFFPIEVPQDHFSKECTVVSSSDDRYMSTKEAQTLAQSLKAEHIIFENMGHINSDSGYGAWPWVLDRVKDF